MITIGLTGGIGSGKSVVASLLEVYGMPVYTADEESKRLLGSLNPNINPNPNKVLNPVRVETVHRHSLIREQLTALLGDSIFDADGLNRRLMASLIFNDAKLLEQVNAIIHPEVGRHFRSWVERQTTKYAVLETAILFESNFDRYVDCCLMVYAPHELRIKRVMARDGITEAEVLQRMQHQLPDEEKKERADYVIYNDDKQPLIPQIEKFVQDI
jgi:dephospho-CoA kinase